MQKNIAQQEEKMAQITCKNLTLGYENRAIQENLNFSINTGDYLCIVGENGSGKSTLMKTLLHLQPPISGTIGFVKMKSDIFRSRHWCREIFQHQ